jgi:hypothetical protein
MIEELDDIFASDEPVIVSMGKTKIPIQVFRAEDFSQASAFTSYVANGFTDDGYAFVSKITSLPIDKVKSLKAKAFLALIEKIMEVNADFFAAHPQWAMRIERLILGPVFSQP